MSVLQEKRVYGDVVSIKYNTTKEFFEHRGALAKTKNISILNATMYQDKNPELVVKRDQYEKDLVLPLLELKSHYKVLDIGCGTGRWGFLLANYVDAYLGVDFSSELIQVARENQAQTKGTENLQFQNISATEIGDHDLVVPPPFHLFIIAGLMAYLNDADCQAMLAQIPELAAPQALIYIREPIAVNTRLTLDDIFSEELNSFYSAIYRTDAEYKHLFNNSLRDGGFSLSHQQILFPEELCNRKETTQKIFLYKKSR